MPPNYELFIPKQRFRHRQLDQVQERAQSGPWSAAAAWGPQARARQLGVSCSRFRAHRARSYRGLASVLGQRSRLKKRQNDLLGDNSNRQIQNIM